MQISAFYELAKNYAETLKQVKPYYFDDPDNTICIVMTSTQEIYSGVSGVKITEGSVETVHSEYNAIMSMIYDNKAKALQMAILALEDYSLRMPCDECLDFLLRIDEGNADCEIIVSPEQSIPAVTLKAAFSPITEDFLRDTPAPEETTEAAGDFTEGFDAPPAEDLGAPAEFVSGFDFDDSNPFLDGGFDDGGSAPPPVKAITDQPIPNNDQPADPQDPSMMGDVPPQFQQPMGGYPQNPYQQPMGGYPQNPYQQPMGGYPQNPYGYPQSPYGYPQSPYGYPQSPYGYPQSPYGYPQQNPYQQQGTMMDSASPYAGNPGTGSMYVSGHTGAPQPGMPAPTTIQPEPIAEGQPTEEENMMKRRLASLLGSTTSKPAQPQLSKEEMMKRAKEMKKAAKQSEKLKKQF